MSASPLKTLEITNDISCYVKLVVFTGTKLDVLSSEQCDYMTLYTKPSNEVC